MQYTLQTTAIKSSRFPWLVQPSLIVDNYLSNILKFSDKKILFILGHYTFKWMISPVWKKIKSNIGSQQGFSRTLGSSVLNNQSKLSQNFICFSITVSTAPTVFVLFFMSPSFDSSINLIHSFMCNLHSELFYLTSFTD